MEDLILKRIGGLIAAHSGIFVREQDYHTLAEKLWKRARTLGLHSLEDYYSLLWKELEAGVGATLPVGREGTSFPTTSEWQELYTVLTINESYFFRDKNQFHLLTEKLLPELIQHKQAAAQTQGAKGDMGFGEGKPSLRIWSAGCSTGEELYSLAIVLEEMQFPWQQWNTLLIGTDISKTAIETAQRGIYGKWSFRQVPSALQQKYFYHHHQLFQIHETIRRKVKFVCGNLLKDVFPRPGSDLCDVDLILCRNVFIYLDSHAIGEIIRKFHDTLSSSGYLITGHTELYGQDTSQFQVVSYPESVIYRRRNSAIPPPSVLPAQGMHPRINLPSVLPVVSPLANKLSSNLPSIQSRALLSTPPTPKFPKSTRQEKGDRPADLSAALAEAERLLQQEAYKKAIRNAEKIFSTYPHCDAAVTIAAHAYANIGSHEEAKSLCQRVLKRQPLSVEMYYLLAQIAEEQNQLDMTKDYLRKIIYLDSSFVRAYLDLASIYEREKQPEKMKKMKAYALVLLDKLAPDTILDAHTGTTVQQWKEHLRQIC